MNLKEIKEMINLMNEHGITELEMEREGLKIKLKKGSAMSITPHLVPIGPVPDVYRDKPPAPVPSGQPDPSIESAKPAASAPAKNLIEIRAPMVGTFYRAPAPDADPFVEVGQTIEEDQVLCIIEAMKLMNEIKSEVKGRIVEIPVANGNPIEYDQILFRIEPHP